MSLYFIFFLMAFRCCSNGSYSFRNCLRVSCGAASSTNFWVFSGLAELQTSLTKSKQDVLQNDLLLMLFDKFRSMNEHRGYLCQPNAIPVQFAACLEENRALPLETCPCCCFSF